MLKTLRSAIFAGIYIGTAGFGFLASGIQSEVYGSLVGAVLFSLGLMAVVGYKLKLYTGTAGFINKNEIGQLFLILFGNITAFGKKGIVVVACDVGSKFFIMVCAACKSEVCAADEHIHIKTALCEHIVNNPGVILG